MATSMRTGRATQAGWVATLRALGIEAPQADGHWVEIEAAYGAASRHYHTLGHLEHMFGCLETVLRDPHPLVSLAVWFHDLVYDPMKQDNEAQSAGAAIRFGQRFGMTASDLQRLEALILSTKAHEPFEDHPECLALLDADLAILAAEPERYDIYARAIRKEYADIPEALYLPGRAAVLSRFLERPCLYFSPDVQALWDAQARLNLRRELDGLKA